MGLGKTVIATDVGGNREVIGEDSTAGFLVPRGDSETLANLILYLAQNEGLRNEIGRRASVRIKSLCNMENVRRFEALFIRGVEGLVRP